MNNLIFLVSRNSIQEVAISLKKIGKTVLRWGLSNAVTYYVAKTQAILFSKTRGKKPKEEVADAKLVFGEQKIKFND